MRDEGVNLDRESDGLAMETPERKQQISSTPVPKFEDSPVFNFLNSLSPIEPVKSLHITQTLNSLNCSSPPSVFTSPHVSSLKESRFLRRHVFADPSKLEFSSENGDKVGRNEDVVNTAHNSTEQQQTSEPGSSTGESSRAIENSRTLRYDCASPDCDLATRSCMKAKFLPEVTGSSTALVPCVQIESGKSFFGSEVHIGGTSHIAEIKESEGCDWENLLSDSADLLVFDSPNVSKSLEDHSQKSLEPGTSFGTSLNENLENTGAAEAVCQSQQYLIDDSQHEDGSDVNEIAENQDILVSLSDCMAGDADLKVDDDLASNLHRGMRRRCLVFEIPGSRQKILGDDSNCGPSVSSQSHDNFASNDKRTVPIRPGNDTRRRSLPGIGLHLNALAATPVDPKVVKTISVSRPAACFSSSNSQETLNHSLLVISSEKDMPPPEGGVPTVEDADHASGYADNEVFDHSSSKKKRRRSENGEESGDCKRCNCKKSKCLKLYCECFAAGVYCVEPCSCQDCFNKPIHVDIVLATRKQIETRNPLAFAPKVIRSSDSVIEAREESRKTPASARHKRGCNCKKSGCLKKYCECFQGGVGCSINCRCEGCKNAFGRKDGTEVEFEEEEVPEGEKSVADKRLQILTDQNKAEQITNFALSATPLHSVRQSNQPPLSSTSKRPPRSFFAIGPSSGLRFGKLTPLPPPPTMLEKQNIQNVNVQEDDMPEILLQRNDGGSPISGVKSASPNSKRVSPPHGNNIGVLSPVAGQRSSRKLILQSIPSFPSLTPPKH